MNFKLWTKKRKSLYEKIIIMKKLKKIVRLWGSAIKRKAIREKNNVTGRVIKSGVIRIGKERSAMFCWYKERTKEMDNKIGGNIQLRFKINCLKDFIYFLIIRYKDLFESGMFFFIVIVKNLLNSASNSFSL
jgi:hypothetical protein